MSTARTQMVDTQIRPADVTDYDIIEAFLNVPREIFVPESVQALAYAEAEITLTDTRKMMSPRCFAKLLQAALPQKDEDVLLVGLGSGYEAAVLSQLVSTVLAIEEDSALLKASEKNIIKADINNVVCVKSKFTTGLAKSAPYDLIIFAGAVDEVPETYMKQLKDGGRLVAITAKEGVNAASVFQRVGNGVAENFEFHAYAPKILSGTTSAEFEF